MWSVESTSTPTSAARRAVSIVSASRISPIMTTSGSWRSAARRPEAKLFVSRPTSRWRTSDCPRGVGPLRGGVGETEHFEGHRIVRQQPDRRSDGAVEVADIHAIAPLIGVGAHEVEIERLVERRERRLRQERTGEVPGRRCREHFGRKCRQLAIETEVHRRMGHDMDVGRLEVPRFLEDPGDRARVLGSEPDAPGAEGSRPTVERHGLGGLHGWTGQNMWAGTRESQDVWLSAPRPLEAEAVSDEAGVHSGPIVWCSMAIPKLKATYSLDADTMRVLERAAQRWGVSKSEALRRAIRSLATATDKPLGEHALDELQAAAKLSNKAADRWARDVRSERKASGRRSQR